MENDKLLQGKYVIGKSSVVGDSRRKKWGDCVHVGEVKRENGDSLVVGIVADGVVADTGLRGAQLAVDTVLVELSRSEGNDIPDILERAMQSANRVVYNENKKSKKDGRTTLVVAAIHANRCFIGNIGNSRAYWAQENGTLLPLTRDHTLYNIYGGDPNAENAGGMVNIIGASNETQVDPGFYLKPDMTKEQACRIGYAGLPLKPGEAILLCSNALIKADRANRRYVKDEEIISLLETEYEPDKAALKLVGIAENRRPTGNVSAVTIQNLSDDLIAQRQARATQAARGTILKRALGIAAGILALAVLTGLTAFFAFRPPAAATPASVTPTLTPAPSLSPTSATALGKARVDDVRGSGGNVKIDQYLDPDAPIFASSDGVRLVVREQGNQGVMYWFGGSSGNIDFDADHMTPMLANGALYIQPGDGRAEVHFVQQPDVMASVEGSRMIVEMVGSDIEVYCFEGQCRLDPGAGSDELKIEVGSKRLYRATLQTAEDPVIMTYDEMWAWNLKCNFCLAAELATPTPTPTRLYTGEDEASPTQPKKDKRPSAIPPTPKPPTPKPPTAEPPTAKPPTDTPVPPTQPPGPPSPTRRPKPRPTLRTTPIPPTPAPLLFSAAPNEYSQPLTQEPSIQEPASSLLSAQGSRSCQAYDALAGRASSEVEYSPFQVGWTLFKVEYSPFRVEQASFDVEYSPF